MQGARKRPPQTTLQFLDICKQSFKNHDHPFFNQVPMPATPQEHHRVSGEIYLHLEDLVKEPRFLEWVKADVEKSHSSVNLKLKALYSYLELTVKGDDDLFFKMKAAVKGKWVNGGAPCIAMQQAAVQDVQGIPVHYGQRPHTDQYQLLPDAKLGEANSPQLFASTTSMPVTMLSMHTSRRGQGPAESTMQVTLPTAAADGLTMLYHDQRTKGCFVISMGTQESVICSSLLERSGICTTGLPAQGGGGPGSFRTCITAFGSFISGKGLATLVLQFTNGQGKGDKGANAAGIVSDIAIVDNLCEQLMVSGCPVELIIGMDMIQQLLINWSPETTGCKLVVAEGEDPFLYGCVIVQSLTTRGLEVISGVEGFGRTPRSNKGPKRGAPTREQQALAVVKVWARLGGLHLLTWLPLHDIHSLMLVLEALRDAIICHPYMSWARPPTVSAAASLLDGSAQLGVEAVMHLNDLISLHPPMSLEFQREFADLMQSFRCKLTEHSLNKAVLDTAVQLCDSIQAEEGLRHLRALLTEAELARVLNEMHMHYIGEAIPAQQAHAARLMGEAYAVLHQTLRTLLHSGALTGSALDAILGDRESDAKGYMQYRDHMYREHGWMYGTQFFAFGTAFAGSNQTVWGIAAMGDSKHWEAKGRGFTNRLIEHVAEHVCSAQGTVEFAAAQAELMTLMDNFKEQSNLPALTEEPWSLSGCNGLCPDDSAESITPQQLHPSNACHCCTRRWRSRSKRGAALESLVPPSSPPSSASTIKLASRRACTQQLPPWPIPSRRRISSGRTSSPSPSGRARATPSPQPFVRHRLRRRSMHPCAQRPRAR
jgi:hypothetical protein